MQCREENAILALNDADADDYESWEDLLEMEESVWNPHSGEGMCRASFSLDTCYMKPLEIE